MNDEYIVMAHRSVESRLGEAHVPCKENGKVLTFQTREGAEAYAESRNQTSLSPFVSYSVVPASTPVPVSVLTPSTWLIRFGV